MKIFYAENYSESVCNGVDMCFLDHTNGIVKVFNPLTRKIQINRHYCDLHEKRIFFFKINVYTTCDKECVLATHVPNPLYIK